MFGEQAFELIKELDRSPDNIPPFNVNKSISIFCFIIHLVLFVQDEGVRQVLKEINALFEENHRDAYAF